MVFNQQQQIDELSDTINQNTEDIDKNRKKSDRPYIDLELDKEPPKAFPDPDERYFGDTGDERGW